MHPTLHMPALTEFIDGTGPVFAGKALPVCIHYHRLRRDQRISFADFEWNHTEDDSRARPKFALVGYGAMLAESMVAIMATDCSLRTRSRNLFRD